MQYGGGGKEVLVLKKETMKVKWIFGISKGGWGRVRNLLKQPSDPSVEKLGVRDVQGTVVWSRERQKRPHRSISLLLCCTYKERIPNYSGRKAARVKFWVAFANSVFFFLCVCVLQLVKR